MYKIEIQNNHSMMCFKNIPDVFLHSYGNLWISLPTWAILRQENHFLPLFPTNSVAICRTLWEICHNMWDILVSHWNFASMYCYGLKQESRYLFNMVRSNVTLHEGIRNLPPSLRVIRADSTFHSFSQAAE